MPHDKKRYLSKIIEHSLKHSPIVGVLGQRQTGKTTAVRHTVGKSYVTLDDPEQLAFARLQPKEFLKSDYETYGIDECQLAPELFPALKFHVQNHKQKGQFIITGSVRFNARKEIRESLTGRIHLLELHPMTISEAQEWSLPDYFGELEKGYESFKRFAQSRMKNTSETTHDDYLTKGGLPGICFFRDRSVRSIKMNSHLDTLLGRDLKLVSETNLSLAVVRELLSFIAQEQGMPLTLTDISRRSQISKNALRKILDALESIFILRRLKPLGDGKKDSYYFVDQGLASHLLISTTPRNDLLRFVYSQVYPHLDYCSPGNISTYYYETRNASSVPLVFRDGKKFLGIIPVSHEVPDRKAIYAAKAFLKKYKNAHVLILTSGSEIFSISDSITAIPVQAIV